MRSSNDVIVYLESRSDRADEINCGLLCEGERLAKLLGGSVSALTDGSAGNCSEASARAVSKYYEGAPARLILFPHTDSGSELAPLVAFYLGAAAVTDCFDVRFRGGNLYYAKYVCGEQFEQEVSFTSSPEIASLNTASFKADGQPALKDAAFFQGNMIRLEISEVSGRKRLSEIIPPDFNTVDIRYAERVLDIGSGCDRPELLEMALELSRLLEASIGATRPVIDSGSLPKSRMIGQTGKSVSPDLLVSLGVSGSQHHVAGVRKSGTILSVNSDRRAPILGVSDTGFIADLNRVLPGLIERIKQYRDMLT